MKRMLINATQKEELRVALVDGQRLYDLDIETVSAKQTKANIYKGKITRVEPSLEAAFVDYGAEKHGFLPIKEIAKEYLSGSTAMLSNGKPNFKKLIKEGQEVMVQVEKEERGNKGAALTTYIGLAGRYLVFMPNNSRSGVSRRIQGRERIEITQILDKLDVHKEFGLIVRTAGVGRTYEEIKWDLEYQMKVWYAISDAYKDSPVGALLYQESNIIVRALRDYFRDDISQVIIDNKAIYDRAHAFMSLVMPDKIKSLHFYKDEMALFVRYQIESQIDSAYGRNVRLPSGGELVVDYTEAMVSIDINSSRSTKGGYVEETAFNTNLEAADEIARQLRLRDIGGLVVVDFIDMYDAKNRTQVEDRIRSAVKIDRARVQMSRISKFGLLEMSRQRLRPSIDEASHSVCPRCKGQGSIRSTQSVALSVLRLLEEDANKDKTAKVIAQLPVKVATFLLNEKRRAILDIEKRNDINILIVANDSLDTPNYNIVRVRNDDDSTDGVISYKMAKDFNLYEDKNDNAKFKNIEHATKEAIVSGISPSSPPPKIKEGFWGVIKRILNIDTNNSNSNEVNKDKYEASSSKYNRKGVDNSKVKRNKNSKRYYFQSENNKHRNNYIKNKSIDKKEYNKNNKPINNKQSNSILVKDNSSKDNSSKDKQNNNSHLKEKKVFINEFAKDKSKIQSGRPVSENAVRGAGKILDNHIAVKDKKIEVNSKETKNNKKQIENVSKQIAIDFSNDNTKVNERIYVPKAVSDAAPTLWMSDETESDINSVNKDSKSIDVNVSSNIENPIASLPSLGQSIWYDNISREFIDSGELQRLINEDNLRGITSNPAIFEKALSSNHSGYLSFLSSVSNKIKSPKDAFFAIAIRDIKDACKIMLPIYESTNGTDGMVSIEVSPDIAYYAEKTIAEALYLNKRLNQKNVMIKVPGTEDGLIAIEQLTYLGININVTLLFSVSRYIDVFKAYMRGLQKRVDMGLPIASIRSVASFFISRIDSSADKILDKTNPELKGKVAIANAKLAYDAYRVLLESDSWKKLEVEGAIPQRLLWASTGTKDPSYSDVMYVESLIGEDTVNTLPPDTYSAFKEHGRVAKTLSEGVFEAKALIELLPNYGVDLDLITQQLERDGILAFKESFDRLLSVLSDKMK